MKNVLHALDGLLRRRDEPSEANPFALLIGAVSCYVLYAAAAGCFQGGASVALAILKIPLIILGAIALCIPSFYVFTALAGAEYSARTFATAIAGFCGVAGLLLVALMPVIWLFSVSTRYLAFVVWLHFFAWLVTLLFARRYLVSVVPNARTVISAWLVLLFFVSLQLTTYVRPVLWRGENEPLFASEKKSFSQHLGDVVRRDHVIDRAQNAPANP
ncbi:MAG: hypothetical protein ACTHQM_22650 [Thermoanaerobaculia bacterium]